MRVGSGFDAHRLTPGVKLFLGGVEIPFEQGLAGHSDGDVLIHAVIDAVLGAAGLGDIGEHFPSSNEKYRGISSRLLLQEVAGKLLAAGWTVGNVDVVVAAERPKLAPYRGLMRQRLAEDLAVPIDRVSVKATTTDHLGFTGRGEGIAAWAVALVERAVADER